MMEILNATANKIGIMQEPWVITTSKGDALYEMSGKLTEQEIMSAIHMARHFAKEAFQEGMEIANNKHSIEVESLMARGQVQLDMLNERIAVISGELLKYMEEEE